MLALAAPAAAQDYPTRPIRVIASQGAGGLSDVWMRSLADELGPALGTTIVVEDRAGAGGTLGARACGEAAPDGYTFCILPAEPILYNPITSPVAGFDPQKSLAPVSRVFFLTQVFAINASLGAKNFKELIAHAKAKPKTLNYMAPSLTKVAFMEELNKANGIDIVRVPFKGGGDAVNNMLTGTTPIAIFGIGNLMQFIRDGKILGLAVDGDKRSALAPEIPTFREVGYTKHLTTSFFGVFAPTGTPKAIIDKMNKAIVQTASKAEFQKRHMTARGLTPVLNSPEEFARELDAERVEAREVIKATGLYPDVK
jgi:tripartite-type tricarboxylate transporter receptor subunit TctC